MHQLTTVPRATTLARVREPIISEGMIHEIGPHENEKKPTKASASTRHATGSIPASAPLGTASSALYATARPPKLAHMPAPPHSSSVRRPTRSTATMANGVTTQNLSPT